MCEKNLGELTNEKENRDKQLIDQQKRKKIEILKEKKYDREYVKNILSDNYQTS